MVLWNAASRRPKMQKKKKSKPLHFGPKKLRSGYWQEDTEIDDDIDIFDWFNAEDLLDDPPASVSAVQEALAQNKQKLPLFLSMRRCCLDLVKMCVCVCVCVLGQRANNPLQARAAASWSQLPRQQGILALTQLWFRLFAFQHQIWWPYGSALAPE